ncbi:MAG: hypothetical protein ACR2PT_03605 [Endozoicomonas sp.]
MGSAKTVGELYTKTSAHRRDIAQSLLSAEVNGYVDYLSRQQEQAKEYQNRQQELLKTGMEKYSTELKKYSLDSTGLLKDQGNVVGDNVKDYVSVLRAQTKYWYSLMVPSKAFASVPAKTTKAVAKKPAAAAKKPAVAEKKAPSATTQKELLTIPGKADTKTPLGVEAQPKQARVKDVPAQPSAEKKAVQPAAEKKVAARKPAKKIS